MIGIDTNVLVRYIVEDDLKQASLATSLIDDNISANKPAFISLMVLCELVWVLTRAYACDRKQIKEVLQNVLLTENFMIEHHDIAWLAFHDYDDGNADYPDCLISRLNQAFECETTWTFDKKASKLPFNKLLTNESL